MESLVIFRDRQEVIADDFTKLGLYGRASLDHAIADGISDDLRYVGFVTEKEGVNTVRVAPGRIYSAGRVYSSLEGDREFNMQARRPLANKKIVLLYAFGRDVEDEVEQRDFVVNVDTQETEPDAVAMRDRRLAELNIVAGTESVDPQAPALPDNACLIATITLSTSGIDEILMSASTRLISVETNTASIQDLQAFQRQIEAAVGSLTSALAKIEAATSSKAERDDLDALRKDIQTLKEANVRILLEIIAIKTQISATEHFEISDEDDYLDLTKTDSGGSYVIAGGALQFAAGGSASLPLQLLNPTDPLVTQDADGRLFPKYENVIAVDIGNRYHSDAPLSQWQSESWGYRRWRTAVRRLLKGSSLVVGDLDPIKVKNPGYRIFYRAHRDYPLGHLLFARYACVHWWPNAYYERGDAPSEMTGFLGGQTFVAPRSFMLTQVGNFFTRIGPSGDLRVLVTGTKNGKPDLDQVLSEVTIPRSSMKRYPLETVIDVPNTYLDAGRSYAVLYLTAGDHWIALSDERYSEGAFFYGQNGGLVQWNTSRDLKIKLYGAKFAQARTEVPLGSLDLAGGIADLQIASQAIAPEGCDLIFEGQVAGAWLPPEEIDFDTVQANLIPLRAVFVGTTDIQPSLKTGADLIKVSRPGNSLAHTSKAIALSQNRTKFVVDLRIDKFREVDHDVAVKLLTGGSYATANQPTSVSDIDEGGGIIRRRSSFELGAGVATYKVKVEGSKTSGQTPPSILDRRATATS